jgi:CHAT domain-containing protein
MSRRSAYPGIGQPLFAAPDGLSRDTGPATALSATTRPAGCSAAPSSTATTRRSYHRETPHARKKHKKDVLAVRHLTDGRYPADAFEVVYTPSLSILHRCAARRQTQRDRLLLIENPTLDLVFADVEGARVRRHHSQVQTLRGRQATRERLLGEFTRCHVWHYDGHAGFNARDPLASALVLQDKRKPQQWLTFTK